MNMKEMNPSVGESEIVDGLRSYWKERSTSYSSQNVAEMNNWKRKAWRDLILAYAPKKDLLRVLDVGTGPGFFAINLALEGHKVTAVDLTSEMLDYAAANAEAYGAEVAFVLNRGEKLPFADDSFDLIVNRNVVWNLEYPEEAFLEWRRVLAPGGRMVYFDANWYLYLYDEELAQRKRDLYRELRKKYPNRNSSGNMNKKRVLDLEEIAKSLPMSKVNRPAWDQKTLVANGMDVIHVIENIGPYVQTEEEQAFDQVNPLFMVCAEKRPED